MQWTPEPPPRKKRRRVTRTADSMMSGFGSSSQVVKDPTPSPDNEGMFKHAINALIFSSSALSISRVVSYVSITFAFVCFSLREIQLI